MIVDLTSFDLHERLAEVSVPTLILYGADEPAVELGGKALHDSMPGSRLTLIPEAGHFQFIEQPSAFHEAVRGFLSEIQ